MKKILSVVLTMLMAASLVVPGFADVGNDRLMEISEGFGIPMDVLYDLDSETVDSLYEDVANNRLVGASTSYAKIYTTESGEVVMEPASYQEYLSRSGPPKTDTDESSGWMRFYTTVYEVDDNTGLASCSYTWLTPATPRLTDVVGISLRNGTVDNDTTSGFYRHSTSNGSETNPFGAADIDEHGGGVVASFRLAGADDFSTEGDYAFIRVNFTKEGNAEGVNGSYAHQRIKFSFNPSYSIDREGWISFAGGLPNISTYYVQDCGYVSITW